MKTLIIDTHCHLYLEDFAKDLDQVLQRAEKEGVEKMFLPAIDSGTHNKMLSLEASNPGRCIAMMGLHPCSVGENYEEELRIVENAFKGRSFAAVGEIGLDFYWDKTFVPQQEDAFARQIELAITRKRPIVIHSRDAIDRCIEIVNRYKGKVGGIFHCFSGTRDQAAQIIDLGFYMGIGGVVTYKNAGLAEVLAGIPLEHIVLETDSPYLTPVPFRGKRNESSYLKFILEKVSQVYGESPEKIAEQTTANAEKIFES